MRTRPLNFEKRAHPARRAERSPLAPKLAAGSKAELLPALLPVPKRGCGVVDRNPKKCWKSYRRFRKPPSENWKT